MNNMHKMNNKIRNINSKSNKFELKICIVSKTRMKTPGSFFVGLVKCGERLKLVAAASAITESMSAYV